MKIQITYTATFDVDVPALAEEIGANPESFDASDIQQELEGCITIDHTAANALTLIEDSDNVAVTILPEAK